MAGEVQRARPSQRGHLYFELVEKGDGDRIVGKLDAVVWRTDFLRLRRLLAESGQQLTDGQQIRCLGRLDFYAPSGRLQLIVSEVDPLFTLGLLERRRRETLAALAAADLIERNRRLPLADVPLRLGVVTSSGSAAYHDFLATLAESGYAFQLFFVHAAVQGAAAEAEIASALRLLAGAAFAGGPLDALVLVRGGGARSDLAVFDSRRVAEAVARSPLPVLTGLGHEIDTSIADAVSHTALKTPTKVAEHLVARVAAAEARLLACEVGVLRCAAEVVRHGREQLRWCERLPQAAALRLRAADKSVGDSARALGRAGRRRLAEAQRELAALAARLALAAQRQLARQRPRADQLAQRLAGLAASRLREAGAQVDGLARVCYEMAPQRVLERGYSVTRDAAGRILLRPDQVRSGEAIVTQLKGGALRSRVEES